MCHGMHGRRIGCQIGLLVIFHFIEKLITLHVPSNGLLNVYIQQLNKVRYLTVVQIFPFASTSWYSRNTTKLNTTELDKLAHLTVRETATLSSQSLVRFPDPPYAMTLSSLAGQIRAHHPVTAGVGLGFWVVPSSHMLKTKFLCHYKKSRSQAVESQNF